MSILLLNKEKDMTSLSAVKQAQKELGFKKAGHGGTLDPLATGVLPIFLINLQSSYNSLIPRPRSILLISYLV